ncbi:MAG: YIP1 family protein [Desulfobacter sp.]
MPMVVRVWDVLRFYAYALIQILIEPSLFFNRLSEQHTLSRALVFLGICAVFNAAACMLTGEVRAGGIVFANALAMVVLSALLGYGSMVVLSGKKYEPGFVFSLYAFALGIPLLVSWLPLFFWFAESWKWWLVYKGLRQACLLSGKHTAIVLVFSLFIQLWVNLVVIKTVVR